MKRNPIIGHLLCPFFLFSSSVNSQAQGVLSLDKAIKIATDSSLASFRAKNLYESGYWQFKTFRAARLPSLTFSAYPFVYNKSFVERYDSQQDMDVYKSQQTLNSYGTLTLSQNIDLTGGTFYIDTYLKYLQGFGASQYKQYTSVPFRVGYSQALFGFNSFKWDKRIEPLHYERVKKELQYNLETISQQTVEYFFDVALNQAIHDMNIRNLASNDTLYRIGQERYKIGSVSQPDLLTLKLNVINSQNELSDSEINLKSSLFKFTSYLRLKNGTSIQCELPLNLLGIFISTEEAIAKARKNNPVYLEQKENVLTAQKSLEKAQKTSRFSASVSASIGFNQVASTFSDSYRNPMRQDVVSVSLSMPILDWGLSKGQINMARSDLDVAKISAEEAEQAFEQEILIAVNEFNNRSTRIKLIDEARRIAGIAYEKTRQLFLIGKADVTDVNQATVQRMQAEINYITSLKNYWLSYYKIRQLTLCDFETNTMCSTENKGYK
ncbi:MAG: Outer rane efflux protein [Bacteroidetes bacterium]|nr:Outer rane efflux protein [Bacteroidota bacterium]